MISADRSQASISSSLKLWSTTLPCAFLSQRFLSDYGLIWVGERQEELEDVELLKDEEELPERSFWKPGKAPVLLAEAVILTPIACLEV